MAHRTLERRPPSKVKCDRCGGRTWRYGYSITGGKRVQRYQCQDCGRNTYTMERKS